MTKERETDKPRAVRFVPYDRRWPGLFAREVRVLSEALADEFVAVHHIGSTAVPGLQVKPTIDTLVEVRDIASVEELERAMEANGYRALGESGIGGRFFFVKEDGSDRTHHVHVFETGGPGVGRHLLFREYLIAHPEEARAYGELKQRLAREHPFDIQAYMEGKKDKIRAMESRAKAWGETRVEEANGSD